MPLEPMINKNKAPILKTCSKCGAQLSINDFTYTHNAFYLDHHLPLCNICVTTYLKVHEFKWEAVDKLCQWADLPFIVREWDRISELTDENVRWETYARIFKDDCYKGLGWADYNNQYKRLREVGLIEEELPLIREERYNKLRTRWGANYDDAQLNYLEDLYNGLLATQNVGGALQIDQAQKLCKLSLEIDIRIRAGDKDVDKFLSSYDKLVKTAEFTPKNTKGAADFDSVAELAFWLEKRGHQNRFYDNVTRDVIDEAIKNIENYNQRLYINEGGIGEAITERLHALKNVNDKEENVYSLDINDDLSSYDNTGFEVAEEFDPGGIDDE